MPENSNNIYIEKIKHLLSQVSIQTYLYALLAIGAIVLIVSNTRLGNKDYLVNKNSSEECRDPRGQTIKIDPSKGEGCIDIFGAARDYGIDLSYMDTNNPSANANNDGNMTVNMSQDLALTNIYLEQNGITNPEEKGYFLSNVILGYKNNIQTDFYTISNLDISRNEDSASYNEYYNDLTKAFNDYNSKMKNFGKNSNVNDLIGINKSFIDTLLKISAPRSGAIYQIELLNLIEKQNTYLNSLTTIDSDPFKFLVLGGEDYMISFKKDLSKVDSDFKKYFNNLGIK